MNVSELIEKYNLTMDREELPERTDGVINYMPDGSNHWRLTIRSAHYAHTLEFSQGPGHRRFTNAKAASAFGCKKGDRVPIMLRTRTYEQAEILRENRIGYHRRPCFESIPPELAEVLECLASDVSLADQYTDIDEFASDLGYTKPSEAIKAWEALRNLSSNLAHSLGHRFVADLLEVEF